MPTEITLDSAVPGSVRGLAQALWGLKSGSTTIMQLIEAVNGGLGVYMVSSVAGERANSNASNSHLAVKEEWNYTNFNPRAASTGTTKGAAGSAGNTELLISNVPCYFGGFITENDTAAGDILVRDEAATGVSSIAKALTATLNTVTVFNVNVIHVRGLTICGSVAGISGVVRWRPLA